MSFCTVAICCRQYSKQPIKNKFSHLTRSCLWLCPQEIWVRDKFSKLSTNFYIDNELYEAILFQIPDNFSLLYDKKLFFMDLKSFLEWVQSNSRSKGSTCTCKKAGNLAKLTHCWGLWLDGSIFLRVENIVHDFGRILFCLCEKHRPLLWLARTHLRMKIYDIPRLPGVYISSNSDKLKTRSRCKFFLSLYI